MKEQFKQSLIYNSIIIVVFIAIAMIYSYPVLQGNILAAGDTTHWRGMSEEARAWHEKTGENPLWTNSMFGGMPTYTTYVQGNTNLLSPIQHTIEKLLQIPPFFFFLAMISFFILMSSWKVNRWIGAIAAVAFAFASYNLQITVAGHNTKMVSIAYLPMVLAGMHWVYNKKYILGAGVALLSLALMISNAMYQIDYYLGIIMVFFAIGYFMQALKEKTIKEFVIASAIMVGVGVLSIGPSLDLFMANKEYAKYTMRGGQSELTIDKKEKKTNGGLDKDYAFQWSQTIGETFTMLVPNLYGGGSQTNVGKSSKTYETVATLAGEENADRFSENANTYWGTQPFLSGPHYYGAIIMLLFVIGLFIIRNNFKWVLTAAAIMGIMMSWGDHFKAFNYFLFDHAPFYNNFRTPNMSMVIAGVVITIIAFWALNEYLFGKIDQSKLIADLKKSVIIVGGLCLLLGVGGRMFLSFKSPKDDKLKAQMIQQFGNNEQAGTQLFDAVVADRPDIAMKDGIRSLIFILLAGAVLWLFAQKKLNLSMSLGAMALLISVDLLGIGTRYIKDENYMAKDEYDAQFNPRPVDMQLKQDPDPYYRIYDLTQDPYNEAMQAFHNKCVGGYHPAKMESYQDLINHQLSSGKMNAQVLDMLNTKYILFNGGQKGEPAIQPNPNACGNAWFVNNVKVVENADQEMLGMNAENFADTAKVENAWKAKETALVQSKYWKQNTNTFVKDSSSNVKLDKYGLNEISFVSSNTNNGFAVFSDIYYPAGWKAYVDGKESEIIKTNYLLRGLYLPAGNHKIEFKFHPDTYFKWGKVSLISSVLILLVLLAGLGITLKNEFKPENA